MNDDWEVPENLLVPKDKAIPLVLCDAKSNQEILRITPELRLEFAEGVTPSDAAKHLAVAWNGFIQQAIEKERERCAYVAENYPTDYEYVSRGVAMKIREDPK